ncbi:MAG: alpha-E domain-containing protein, partial [Pseudomonadota bacterium]
LMSLAAFAGTTAENLTRNHVWRFLELGRSVERSLVFSRAAERLAGRRGEPDEPWLRAWLTLADSRTAYRTRYLTVPAAAPAIDLLIVDENNPRSLVHQLARIERALDRLPSAGPRRGPEQRIALRALTEVRLAEPERLAEPVETGGERQALAELLSCTNARLAELSDQLGRSYFAHTEAPSRLAASGRREA